MRSLVYQDQFKLFCALDSPDYHWPNLKKVPGGELMYLEDSRINNSTLRKHLEGQGYGHQSKYCLKSYEAIVSMAAARLGIAILPERPFKHRAKALGLREMNVGFTIGSFNVYASYLKMNSKVEMLSAFVNEIIPVAIQ